MQLNIKSDEAHRLATALARETGESLTQAVTSALRDKLDRVGQAGSAARRLAAVHAVRSRVAVALTDAGRAPPRQSDLDEADYDEFGLPR